MNNIKSLWKKKKISIGIIFIIWLIVAWLLYPLVTLDSVDFTNAKQYFYRSAIGISIMLIMFGKTVLDLFFPQLTSRRQPLINTIMITIYTIAIAGALIYLVSRMIFLFLKSGEVGAVF